MEPIFFDFPVGDHERCPLHDDQTGSLKVWVNEKGEKWAKCYAGCGKWRVGGGYVPNQERYAQGHKAEEPLDQELVAELECRLAGMNGRDPELEIIRDLELDRRRISHKTYHEMGVRAGRNYAGLPYFFFRVEDAAGKLQGFKMHRIGKHEPKCAWAKVRREGHGMAAELFPSVTRACRVDNFWMNTVALVPGELKALRILSLGYPAVSPTTGEGVDLSDSMIRDLKARNVILLGDQDDVKENKSGGLVCPGARWANRTASQLRGAGIPVTISSCGGI